MIADQFLHLSQYCKGIGLEFAEEAAAISPGLQIRCGRQPIPEREVRITTPWALGLQEGTQDFICCIHYLEHYANVEEIVRYWWSLLKQDGHLVMVLPEAGKYPHVGQRGCNPDHKVNFKLVSFCRDLERYGFTFEIVEQGFVEESFYLVVRKSDKAPVFVDPERVPAYSVVIPVYNGLSMTQKCVDSIFQYGNPAEVICVDDGSTDKIKFTDKRCKIIRLKRNSGFPFAVNKGVDEAKSEFVVLLNNDVVMLPGGFERMLAALKDPSVAMSGQDGGKLGDDFVYQGKTQDDPDYMEMFCVAFRKTVWSKIGPLDLDFGRGYSEDADWGIRARKAGYKLKSVGACCVHKEAATNGRGPEILAQIERNTQILKQKHYRGRCCWVMASLGCNGGSKVVQKMASAMQDDGWQVDVCSFTPWETACAGWERFGHKTTGEELPTYDAVFSTFHSTMPFAHQMKAGQRFALIQSDEPEWPDDAEGKDSAAGNFRLPGFKCIIIADHMREFEKKYGMHIVGQIPNGVDNIVFTPTWLFEREWPHKIMVVRKSSDTWYTGWSYVEEAVRQLSQKYHDFGVVVLGGDRPRWSCEVEHVRTFDEREICGLYNKVSCVVIPSLIEGSSLVPLEAMASGCPVVTTRVGVDYGVEGENVLFVPYKSSGAIVKAVSRVFEDRELRERLYKYGLKTAHERTWEREQEEFLSIVRRETA